MTALSHAPAAFAIHRISDRERHRVWDGARAGEAPSPTLRLLPSGDGWSLVADNGQLVFSALGAQGRRRCLQFARAAGVLRVVS
jgi:hypothetical protein